MAETVRRVRKPVLSKASIYEQLFGTRYRGSGRPKIRDGVEWRLFPAEGADPLMVDVARRRAYAVVHEENRDRLTEVFQAELKVLSRRGKDQVLADARKKPVALDVVATPEGEDDGEA